MITVRVVTLSSISITNFKPETYILTVKTGFTAFMYDNNRGGLPWLVFNSTNGYDYNVTKLIGSPDTMSRKITLNM